MDKSYQLLSSMSPKLNPRGKNTNRRHLPATKLALKKYFRRSSIFEGVMKKKDKDVTTITIESTSTESKNGDKSPIVISDTDEESPQKTPFLSKYPTTKSQRPQKKLDVEETPSVQPPMSTVKIRQIEEWLQKVDNTQKNETMFSEISCIISEGNPHFRSPNTNVACNSTYIDLKFPKRFDELFPQNEVIPETEKSVHSNSSDIIESSFQTPTKLQTANRDTNSNRVFMPLENVPSKEKCSGTKNCSDNSSGKLLKRITDQVAKIDLGKAVDSNDKDSDEEAARLLDEVYGATWRHNQSNVLPTSVPKVQQKKNFDINAIRTNLFNTDGNLLKNLHRQNVKKHLPSPWKMRFQNVCDSDSDCQGDDADSDLENRIPVNKVPIKGVGRKNTVNSVQPTVPTSKEWATESESGSDISESDKKVKPTAKPKTKTNNKPRRKPRKLTEQTEQPHNLATPSNVKTYTFLESLSEQVPVDCCDFGARVFRTCYAKYRHKLAKKLFDLFNDAVFDNALPPDTSMEWSKRLTATAGMCRCKKRIHGNGQVEREAKIVLSEKVLTSADRLRDTLVHEMCHAATYVINEVSDGHGPFWQSWAQKAMRAFPELPPIKRCHQYDIQMKYTYKCTGCSYRFVISDK